MRRIALPTIAAMALMVVTPLAVSAEPMVLTATQMDSVNAAARSPVVNVNVVVQTIQTTQIANAFALSFATCGICKGGVPSASALASAINANTSGQLVGR
jgi:hypothetical protein